MKRVKGLRRQKSYLPGMARKIKYFNLIAYLSQLIFCIRCWEIKPIKLSGRSFGPNT